MIDTSIERRDDDLPEQVEEAVVTALLNGDTMRAVRRRFDLTLDQIDRIIAKTWPVDNRARVRMIMTDLGKLDRLITEFYNRSLAGDDATSAAFASVAIKAMERKHELTGMSAATRIDLQVIHEPVKAPTRHERIREAVFRLKYGPDWKPPSDGNGGDGAANAPPDGNGSPPTRS